MRSVLLSILKAINGTTTGPDFSVFLVLKKSWTCQAQITTVYFWIRRRRLPLFGEWNSQDAEHLHRRVCVCEADQPWFRG